MYGYSVDEVRGQPITVLAAHQDTAPLTTMFEAAIRGEKVQPVEMLHEGTSGRTVRVLLRVAAIYDSTKNVIGVSWWAQNLAEWDTQELPIRSSISMDDSTPPA